MRKWIDTKVSVEKRVQKGNGSGLTAVCKDHPHHVVKNTVLQRDRDRGRGIAAQHSYDGVCHWSRRETVALRKDSGRTFWVNSFGQEISFLVKNIYYIHFQ